MSNFLPFTTTTTPNTNDVTQNTTSPISQPVVDDKEIERISKCQEECKKPRTKFLGLFGGKKSKKSSKKSRKNNKSRKNGKSRKNKK